MSAFYFLRWHVSRIVANTVSVGVPANVNYKRLTLIYCNTVTRISFSRTYCMCLQLPVTAAVRAQQKLWSWETRSAEWERCSPHRIRAWTFFCLSDDFERLLETANSALTARKLIQNLYFSAMWIAPNNSCVHRLPVAEFYKVFLNAGMRVVL